MPSLTCQPARKPEQVLRQRTVGNSTRGFATLGAPPVISSDHILKLPTKGSNQTETSAQGSRTRRWLQTSTRFRQSADVNQAAVPMRFCQSVLPGHRHLVKSIKTAEQT